MKIQIIIGSTRQNRATPRVARWVETTAREVLTGHVVSTTDLKELGLPFFDEPLSPQGNPDRQVSAIVKPWLASLADADALVFVTPEYNHGVPAALKNAIDFVDTQLRRKPVALVGHGAVGGARSIEQLRLVLGSSLGAAVIPETVTLVGSVSRGELLSEAGAPLSERMEKPTQKLRNLLVSLQWYGEALKAKRDS